MKYIKQILTLSLFSYAYHLGNIGNSFFFYLSWLVTGCMYVHALSIIFSKSYRKELESTLNILQILIAAWFAAFNIMYVLKGSVLNLYYGIGVAFVLFSTTLINYTKEENG